MDSPGEPDGEVLDGVLEVVREVGQAALLGVMVSILHMHMFCSVLIHHWLRRGVGIHEAS